LGNRAEPLREANGLWIEREVGANDYGDTKLIFPPGVKGEVGRSRVETRKPATFSKGSKKWRDGGGELMVLPGGDSYTSTEEVRDSFVAQWKRGPPVWDEHRRWGST